MNKEGHIGVVKNAKQPIVKKIEKVEISQNLLAQGGAKSSHYAKNGYTPLVINNSHGRAREDNRLTITPPPKNLG